MAVVLSPVHSKSKIGSPGRFNATFPAINPASSSPRRSLHANLTAPLYDEGYYGQIEDLEPPASLWTGDSCTVSVTSNSTSINVSRQESPDPVEHAVDDTSIRTQPFRHVDYLSHIWEEEEHIASQRKEYDNSIRLENASWRTWTKLKNKLKTISPESLNWLKDGDVTWLYEPLQTESIRSLRMPPSPPESSILKPNSFSNKGPILTKRRMSEVIFQRSLSVSSLPKQAAVAFRTLPSGLKSPSLGEKRHIHFNEQVEQYIALETTDDDEESDSYAIQNNDDSDSDDGAIMMKTTKPKQESPLMTNGKATPQASFSGDSKKIAILRSTTLNYGEYHPKSPEPAMEHSSGFGNSCKLSQSPLQGTPRLSNPASLVDDFEEDDEDMYQQLPSTFTNRKNITQEYIQTLQTYRSFSGLNGDPLRKPLCMFIPYEDEEDELVSGSLFGKVINTINTANDIAYLIWKAG